MKKEQLEILEKLTQFPLVECKARCELLIGKNDPKNGAPDYWFCIYGDIHLTGYYSLPKLLSDFADECVRLGYVEMIENSLLSTE